MNRQTKRILPSIFLGACLLMGCGRQVSEATFPQPGEDGCYHVRAGEDVQAALDAAARNPVHKTVILHKGVHRPRRYAQALVRFNREHDGVVLQGKGKAVLSAANPDIADPARKGFPAMVNHVVYFGDGVSQATSLCDLTITDAGGFVGDDSNLPPIERDLELPQLQKHLFFYADGGAIKVFGRSSPTIERVEIRDNQTRLCGGGVSVEQRGFSQTPAIFRDCVFLNNRCPGTGAAVDVLSGSFAVIENCLFVGNIANTGMDEIKIQYGLEYNSEHGCGALTVFPQSRVEVRRCTFTGNSNGADDHGAGSVYEDTIFWQNDAQEGSRPGAMYELDILDASGVRGCFFSKKNADLRGSVNAETNNLGAPDPQFDELYRPQAEEYAKLGYRPTANRGK